MARLVEKRPETARTTLARWLACASIVALFALLALQLTGCGEDESGTEAQSVTNAVSQATQTMSIRALVPNQGGQYARTTVKIQGSNFFGQITVLFSAGDPLAGGSPATVVGVSSDGSEITCIPPYSSVTGSANVLVRSSTHGRVAAIGAYTYNPPPTITTISPTQGPLAGNTAVTITGTNFGGTVSVKFGTGVGLVTGATSTVIQCETPAATAGGWVDVTVCSTTNGDGVAASGFYYQPAPWTPVASDIVGAHVRALAVDPVTPSVIYAGGRFPGLYKSTNGGTAWVRIYEPTRPTQYLYQGVESLAIDPRYPQTIYATGAGDVTASGVFKSTDGGASWNRILALPAVERGALPTNVVAVHPSFPDQIYVRHAGGFTRSPDGGQTWIAGGALPATACGMIVPHPAEQQRLYLAVPLDSTAPGGLYHSLDNGTTWNVTFTLTGLRAVALDPSNPDRILVAGSSLYQSIDSGGTWIARTTAFEASDAARITAIAHVPTNSQVVYVATSGQRALYRSLDGGTSWTAMTSPTAVESHADAYRTVVVPTPGSSTDRGLLGASNGVFQTTDGGTTWNLSVTGMSSLAITSLVVDPGNSSLVYASTAGGGVYKSSDAGQSWTTANTSLSNWNVRELTIDPADSSVLYAALGRSGLEKSTDSGATWAPYNNGLAGATIVSLGVYHSVSTTVFAGTSGRRIYKSDDGGLNWVAVYSPAPVDVPDCTRAICFSSIPGVIGYAANSSELVKSTDGGTTWAPVLGGDFTDVSSAPGNASLVYALIGTATQVSRSTDGGASFTLVGPVGPSSISVVEVDPVVSSTVWAGTSSGAYKTTDSGAVWTALTGASLNQQRVDCLAIDPNSHLTVYAGNYFGGLYKTGTGGQ